MPYDTKCIFRVGIAERPTWATPSVGPYSKNRKVLQYCNASLALIDSPSLHWNWSFSLFCRGQKSSWVKLKHGIEQRKRWRMLWIPLVNLGRLVSCYSNVLCYCCHPFLALVPLVFPPLRHTGLGCLCAYCSNLSYLRTVWVLCMQINEADGAFYGPKIDITVFDALKRKFQCATIQVIWSIFFQFYVAGIMSSHRKVVPSNDSAQYSTSISVVLFDLSFSSWMSHVLICIGFYNRVPIAVGLPASNTVQPFFFDWGWCQERETSYHPSSYSWICRKDVCYSAWALCRKVAVLAEPASSYCLPGFREIYTICTRGLSMHCFLHWQLECALVYPIFTFICCIWEFQLHNYC